MSFGELKGWRDASFFDFWVEGSLGDLGRKCGKPRACVEEKKSPPRTSARCKQKAPTVMEISEVSESTLHCQAAETYKRLRQREIHRDTAYKVGVVAVIHPHANVDDSHRHHYLAAQNW